MTKFYIPSLDGLRGLAVTSVFLFHFGRLANVKVDFEVGWVGVQLFFVLSGYLITRILLEQKNQPLSGYLTNFYWRRSLRIFPLYFGYLTILTCLYITFHLPESFSSVAGYLFSYTFNFSVLSSGLHINRMFTHLWSLCVEEQFYLVWPFIVYFLSTRQLKHLMVTLLIVIPLFRLALYLTLSYKISDPETLGTSIYWLSPSQFDAFAIGGVVNFFPTTIMRLKSRAWLYILLLIIVSAGAFNFVTQSRNASFTSLGFEIHAIDHFDFIWVYSLLNLLFAATIWFLLQYGSSILSARPMVFIGKISYGIYVLHFPIMGLMSKTLQRFDLPDVLAFFIYAALTLMAAWASFEFYEKRFLKLKDNLSSLGS